MADLNTADYLAMKDRILAVFPRAERVVLFGSRARGTARPDSDVDLLVVVPTSLSRAERGAQVRLALRDFHVGFDIIVLTPEEWSRLRTWTSTVVAQADSDGQVLHAAA
jgi:predicted nucleotidyltransferase